MNTTWRQALATLVLVLVLMANGCWAGLAEGKAAFEQQDYARALAEFRPLATRGNASAQFHLALMHDGGLGVPKDEAQAVRWYRKAAQQGLTVAQFNLGVAM